MPQKTTCPGDNPRVVSRAHCLGAILPRGRFSPGQVVSGAYCLLGRTVLGHIVSEQAVSGHHVPSPLFHYQPQVKFIENIKSPKIIIS